MKSGEVREMTKKCQGIQIKLTSGNPELNVHFKANIPQEISFIIFHELLNPIFQFSIFSTSKLFR